MNSSERMPIAEGTANHLAATVQERLTARAGMALVGYRRFAPELCYGRHRGPAGPDARPAAVVALFYPSRGQWHLPLILRPAWMSEHAGQISLPGGGAEPGETAAACALRELHEELGVAPAGVRMLGSLPPIYVYASNFLVRPFVALATQRPAFQPDSREVAELLELPVPHLVNERNYETHTMARGQLSYEAPCMTFQGRHIWGATALILGELLNIIVDPERGNLFT
jgi:8-oxo-dGTP pyrophosphatase MutT (NUDIX family)